MANRTNSHLSFFIFLFLFFSSFFFVSASASTARELVSAALPFNLQCAIDLQKYFQPNKNDTSFTTGIRMIDASGKLSSGLLEGNTKSLGSYSECTALPEAHYCISQGYIAIQLDAFSRKTPPPQILGNTIGLCVPSSCDNETVALIFPVLTSFLNQQLAPVEVQMQIGTLGISCLTKPSIDAGAAGAIFLVSFFAFLVLFCTAFHYAYDSWAESQASNRGYQELDAMLVDQNPPRTRPKPKYYIFIQSFSLLYNLPRLFSTTTRDSSLSALNGLRVMSMFWVILGHTYLWTATSFANPVVVIDVMRRFTFQIVTGGVFAVDTFFFLSGFLLAFLTVKELRRKNGKLPWALFYFHRFWRLTPTYMFCIFIFYELLPLWVDGPLMGGATQTVESCQKYWWTNLLYVNNFYPAKNSEGCIGWSWYLANDMQFFVLTPLALVLFYRSKKLALGLLSFLLVACWITTAVLAKVKDIWGAMDITRLADRDYYMDKIYTKPYARAGPYIIGLAMAFLYTSMLEIQQGLDNGVSRSYLWGQVVIVGNRDPGEEGRGEGRAPKGQVSIILQRPFLVVGSLLSGFLMCLVVFANYKSSEWTTAQNILFITFSNFAWSLGLSFITLVCITGHGGWVNTFLSISPWTVMARFTYTAYLIHPIFMYIVTLSLGSPIYYFDLLWVMFFISFAFLTFLFAAMFTLLLEMPLGNLEKLFLHSSS